MPSQITVPYTTMADSGIQMSVPDTGGPVAIVKYKCLWTDVFQLVNDLKGTATANGNAIIRSIPYAYPPSTQLYCLAIDDISTHGPGILWFNMLARKYAIVTARFGVPPYQFDGPQAWTSITLGIGGEFMTLPGSTYRFPSGTPTNTPIGKVICQIEINLKRHMMPYIPFAEMAALAGQVNNATYTIGNYSFPEGTLLFMGGPTEIDIDSAGNITNEVEYKMIFRSVPWNQYLSPDRTGGFQGFQIVTDGGGNPPYTEGDFTTLP